LPPPLHVVQGIARDAAVHEDIVAFGVDTHEVGGAHLHIPMSEEVVLIMLVALLRGSHHTPAATPSAIGNRIADEEHPSPRLFLHLINNTNGIMILHGPDRWRHGHEHHRNEQEISG